MSDLRERLAEARKRARERERKQKVRNRLEYIGFLGSLVLIWLGGTIWWAATWTP